MTNKKRDKQSQIQLDKQTKTSTVRQTNIKTGRQKQTGNRKKVCDMTQQVKHNEIIRQRKFDNRHFE